MQPIRHSLILAAVSLALAAPVTAQDTPAEPPAPPADAPAAPAPEAPATEAPDAAAPAAEAPAAAPEGQAPAEPAEGTAPADAAAAPPPPEVMEIVRDKFGDWEIRCAPEGNDCFMYQLALDTLQNPVAEVSILKLPEEAEATAGVTVVSPLGTLLPAGVVMQIDAGKQERYAFHWCSQVGCFARFGLDLAGVDAMKRGNGAKLTLLSVGNPETPVTLALSLSGFTAAYDALEVATQPPAPAAAPAPAPAPAAPLAAPAQN
jgi:invasion protein IalB